MTDNTKFVVAYFQRGGFTIRLAEGHEAAHDLREALVATKIYALVVVGGPEAYFGPLDSDGGFNSPI